MTHRFQPLHRLPRTPLVLDGQNLAIDDVVAVARGRRRVAIAETARERVRRSRIVVDLLLARHLKVYGLTTGFGQLRDVQIPESQTRQLQINLIRSHAAGVGAPFDEDVVRAAILLRINTLCVGRSGIREETIERLLAMLNDDVYPFVPQQGSVGACGDLAPLSHLALAVVGDPAARYLPAARRARPGDVVRAARAEEFAAFPGQPEAFAALARAEGWQSFRPATLEAKEGLALNNGTAFMTAVLALAIHDVSFTLRWSEAAAAMSMEAHQGQPASLDARIHAARPHSGQPEVAARLREWLAGSQLVGNELNVGHLDAALAEIEATAGELRSDSGAAARRLAAVVAELHTAARALVPAGPDAVLGGKPVAALQALPGGAQIGFLRPLVGPVVRAAEQAIAALPDLPDSCVPARLRRVAASLRAVVAESPHVQDDYSSRCFPVVAAAAWRALEHAASVVQCEINSATDNPLVFAPQPPPEEEPVDYRAWLSADPARTQACIAGVVGGGNFHGHPIAAVADYLALAMAAIGNVAERRIAHLVDRNHSRGLPGFLVRNGGLESGFMLAQYTAAALVAENKVLCHPASVDSIPTCANTEDWVSMGTLAARKAADVQRHVAQVVAIELALTTRALQFRSLLQPGTRLRRLLALLSARCLGDPVPEGEDRPLAPVLERARTAMQEPQLLDLLL